MSTVLAFDTLKCVDALEQANVPREQARAIVEVVRESREITLAEQSSIARMASEHAVMELDTKTVRAILELDAKTDRRFAQTAQAIAELDAKTDLRFAQTAQAIAELDSKTMQAIAQLEKKVDVGLAEVRGDIKLLKWMFGGLIAALFAVSAALATAALRVYFGG